MRSIKELDEFVVQDIETKVIRNTRKLNEFLYQEVKIKKRKILTVDIDKQDCVAVGLDEKVWITFNHDAGDLFGALNNGASLVLNGNAGRFAGDVMRSGKITIKGNCDEGAGMYMYGGQVIVNGSAGDNIGQISKGGTILIKGDAGNFVGLYLTGGNIIVLNDIGEKTGDWMIKGRIFVGGYITGLGNNAIIQEMKDNDREFLDALFTENKIQFPLDNIRKIVPKELRPFYKKR
ncbi:hypothetical protein ES705_08481 [subsurface metagenome]